MRPEHIYPGLAAKFVRSLLPPDLNRSADIVRAREIGMVVKVCTPTTVATGPGGHDIWWVRRQDGRMTIIDVSEIEPANKIAEAVMAALNMFRNAMRIEAPEEIKPRTGRLFKTQAEAWDDGWRQAMKHISRESDQFLWSVDPW